MIVLNNRLSIEKMAVANNIVKTIFGVILISYNIFTESSYIVTNVPEESQLIFAHVVSFLWN